MQSMLINSPHGYQKPIKRGPFQEERDRSIKIQKKSQKTCCDPGQWLGPRDSPSIRHHLHPTGSHGEDPKDTGQPHMINGCGSV